MSATPNVKVYPTSVRPVQAVVTAAKTSYADLQYAVKLCTIGASGGLLKKLKAIPRGTISSAAIQLQAYVTKSTDTSDANPFLMPVSAILPVFTMAANAVIPVADFGFTVADPRRCEAGDKIWVAAATALAAGIVFDGELEEFGVS